MGHCRENLTESFERRKIFFFWFRGRADNRMFKEESGTKKKKKTTNKHEGRGCFECHDTQVKNYLVKNYGGGHRGQTLTAFSRIAK